MVSKAKVGVFTRKITKVSATQRSGNAGGEIVAATEGPGVGEEAEGVIGKSRVRLARF